MTYPKKNRLYHWITDAYVKFIIRRHFHTIKFDSTKIDPDRSVLLIGNHFSIWDGLLLYWLNDKLLKKNFHAMILEETSKNEPILKYSGCFSIKKDSRDSVLSLHYAAELLHNPLNLVLIFPQGKLYSNFASQLNFEKGVMKILNRAGAKFNIIFAATFVESFKQKKNTAFIYLKTLDAFKFTTIDEFTCAYQQHYDAAKTKQTEIIL